eukprot:TRINITY_DN1181_c0_g1_i1.p1 TRINITY_DN1181_c0_g1~~TRINITY_DN1181_c0_g1_i1.p1  ORF type:complete len:2457 (-),score=612.33 TRINITY_DN1181_c0_g1_i1:74-7093(-)
MPNPVYQAAVAQARSADARRDAAAMATHRSIHSPPTSPLTSSSSSPSSSFPDDIPLRPGVSTRPIPRPASTPSMPSFMTKTAVTPITRDTEINSETLTATPSLPEGDDLTLSPLARGDDPASAPDDVTLSPLSTLSATSDAISPPATSPDYTMGSSHNNNNTPPDMLLSSPPSPSYTPANPFGNGAFPPASDPAAPSSPMASPRTTSPSVSPHVRAMPSRGRESRSSQDLTLSPKTSRTAFKRQSMKIGSSIAMLIAEATSPDPAPDPSRKKRDSLDIGDRAKDPTKPSILGRMSMSKDRMGRLMDQARDPNSMSPGLVQGRRRSGGVLVIKNVGNEPLFGQTLRTLVAREGPGTRAPYIPHVAHALLTILSTPRALASPYVLGVDPSSPSYAHMNTLRRAIDAGEEVALAELDPPLLSGLFHLWLHLLPEPIVPVECYEQIVTQYTNDRLIDEVLNQLPVANRVLLWRVLEYLDELLAYAGLNGVTLAKVSGVFGRFILRPANTQAEDNDPAVLAAATAVTIMLIGRHKDIFGNMEEHQNGDTLASDQVSMPGGDGPAAPALHMRVPDMSLVTEGGVLAGTLLLHDTLVVWRHEASPASSVPLLSLPFSSMSKVELCCPSKSANKDTKMRTIPPYFVVYVSAPVDPTLAPLAGEGHSFTFACEDVPLCKLLFVYLQGVMRAPGSTRSSRQPPFRLDLFGQAMSSLPERACKQLTLLQELNLARNALPVLPIELACMTALKSLSLEDNAIAMVDDRDAAIIGCRLAQLESLSVGGNKMVIAPRFTDMIKLRTLHLNNNCFANLPLEIFQLPCLEVLNLSHNRLVDSGLPVPPPGSVLSPLRVLDVRDNKLRVVPELFLSFPQLQILNMDDNSIIALPHDIARLNSLVELKLNNNRLTGELPVAITCLSCLKRLSLDNNQIKYLPGPIGDMVGLTELRISNNALAHLPVTLTQLVNVVTLEVHGNPISSQGISEDILRGGNKEALFAKLREGLTQMVPHAHMRVVVIGDAASGKSSVIRALNGTKPAPVAGMISASQENLLASSIGMSFGDKDFRPAQPNQTQDTGVSVLQTSSFAWRTKRLQGMDAVQGAKKTKHRDVHVCVWECRSPAGVSCEAHRVFLTSGNPDEHLQEGSSSPRPVAVVLVWDLSETDEHRLGAWLHDLDSHAHDYVSILLVGTHADDPACTKKYLGELHERLTRRIRAQFPKIAERLGLHFVHALKVESDAIQTLRRSVKDAFAGHARSVGGLMATHVPQAYVEIDEYVRSHAQIMPLITPGQLRDKAVVFGLKRASDFIRAKRFLESNGTLLDYSRLTPAGRVGMKGGAHLHSICCDPEWLAKTLHKIITRKRKTSEITAHEGLDGFISHGALLQELDVPPSYMPGLLSALERCQVGFSVYHTPSPRGNWGVHLGGRADDSDMRGEGESSEAWFSGRSGFLLVPACLPGTNDLPGWATHAEAPSIAQIRRRYVLEYIPGGLFGKLVTRVLMHAPIWTCSRDVVIIYSPADMRTLSRLTRAESARFSFEPSADMTSPPPSPVLRSRSSVLSPSSSSSSESYNVAACERVLIKLAHDTRRLEITGRLPLASTPRLLVQVLAIVDALINEDGGRLAPVQTVACGHCMAMRLPDPYMFSLRACLNAFYESGVQAQVYCQKHISRSLGSSNPTMAGSVDMSVPVRVISIVPEAALLAHSTKIFDKEEALNIVSCADTDVRVPWGAGSGERLYQGCVDSVGVLVRRYSSRSPPPEQLMGDMLREVVLLTRCAGPRVLPLRGVTMGTVPALVFDSDGPCESVPPTLREFIVHRAPGSSVPWHDKLKLATDIAEAMCLMHSHTPPYLYQALSMDTVLVYSLQGALNARLACFGQACPRSLLLPPSGPVPDHSPSSPSPELYAQLYSSDERAEVYAYGVLLWELVTATPFLQGCETNRSPAVVSAAMPMRDLILAGQRPAIPGDCFPPLADLIMDCWQGDPKGRPPFSSILGRLQDMKAREWDPTHITSVVAAEVPPGPPAVLHVESDTLITFGGWDGNRLHNRMYRMALSSVGCDTLTSILANPSSPQYAGFVQHLNKEYSDENVIFYEELRHFKKLVNAAASRPPPEASSVPEGAWAVSSPDEGTAVPAHPDLHVEALRIYMTYTSETSAKQVNLSARVRQALQQALCRPSEGSLFFTSKRRSQYNEDSRTQVLQRYRELFQDAENEALTLLEDCFLRFQKQAEQATRAAVWRPVECSGTIPPPMIGHSMFVYDKHKAIVLAGWDGKTRRLNEVYVLDLRTYHWKLKACSGDIPPAPPPSCPVSAVLAGECVMLFTQPQGTPDTRVYQLHLASYRWVCSKCAVLPALIGAL